MQSCISTSKLAFLINLSFNLINYDTHFSRSGPVLFQSLFLNHDTLPDFIDYTIDLNVLYYYINIQLECMNL